MKSYRVVCRPQATKLKQLTNVTWEEAGQYTGATNTQVASDAPGLENQYRFAAFNFMTTVDQTRMARQLSTLHSLR